MKFSQRIGKTPVSKNIQLESIDEELRNGLWNIYNIYILEKISDEYDHYWEINPGKFFSNSMWHHYFKKTIDNIPRHFYDVEYKIREYFFSCEWYELYDFIEFTIELIDENKYFKEVINKGKLFENFNYILEREFAGYRFVNEKLSPITNPTEINEIQEALAITETDNFTSLNGCNTHLGSALKKLSDRQSPDYRNSIKESISAVESLAKAISGNTKDTLTASIDKIKEKLKIHPALERGFKQIYGYTSDTDGIRHALTEESSCDFEDAKFMLVSCSAFVNYLIIKANKAGVKFYKETAV